VPNLATQGEYVTHSAPPRDYMPEEQRAVAPIGLTFILRISTDPAPVFAAINQVVRREDPSLFTVLQTMEEAMAPLTAQARTVGSLAVGFGSVAMLLSAIGLYGVLAYGVTRRRGEIGIRIALGAARGRVVWMILRESAIVVTGGLLLGLGPAYAVSKTVRAQYSEFAPPNTASLWVAALILIVVAFSAAYLPARRASKLDPMTALRQE
jgi:ABC-type antimicrobial peptide transport system permease subunit